jgi:molybdate transport system substrate-binding protein
MRMPIVKVIIAAFALHLASAAAAAELLVSAAASLTNAFTDIGQQFERAHPQTKVLFNFGGSGQLLQQIAKGAPVDVFASADQETMDQAAADSVIDSASRFDFARNALVVVVPIGSNVRLTELKQLTGAGFRHIAIGNPQSVPVGRYSKRALSAAGMWESVQQKVVNTQNVRQSLDYVARGEVEAAFVYRTDAILLKDKIRVVLEVPTEPPVLYPVAIVKASVNKSDARSFLACLRTDASQKILRQYGFGKP